MHPQGGGIGPHVIQSDELDSFDIEQIPRNTYDIRLLLVGFVNNFFHELMSSKVTKVDVRQVNHPDLLFESVDIYLSKSGSNATRWIGFQKRGSSGSTNRPPHRRKFLKPLTGKGMVKAI